MAEDKLKRILYVEDEPDIQAVVCVALEHIGGFTLEVCSSGEEALAKAEAFDPDLIMLDVMMPGLDGPTTLSELRKKTKLRGKPAVFMTAKVQPQEIAYYKEIGAVDVIVKPFDPMSLANDVKKIWERWKKQQPVCA